MSDISSELVEKFQNKTIFFDEPFYKSSDSKTIMGEVAFKEILFIEYRDTEAGSNPREYIGLKKTNLQLVRSLLQDSTKMFRFLHSGMILCLTTDPNTNFSTDSIKYDECCLTNGNQTRFVILLIALTKLFFAQSKIASIRQKDYTAFIEETFGESEAIKTILEHLRFAKITEFVNYICKDKKLKEAFDNLDILSFLNSKIRVQVNVINVVIEDLSGNLDTYSAGTLIAEANNDTQKVQPDDIFGNKYKKELQEYLFADFIKLYGGSVSIEYRYGETKEKAADKEHILTLLRLVIPTGLLTKDKEIFKLTNQRDPVYKIFSKLISRINKDNEKAVTAAAAISHLIPLLYKIRTEYVIPFLENYKRELVRNYKIKAFAGELQDKVIGQEIYEAKGNDATIERIIRSAVNYNVEHIMPVVVYRIRRSFSETDSQQLTLTIPDASYAQYFEAITQAVYEKYVNMKLKGLPSSLTAVVRNADFYEFGAEAHTAFQKFNKQVKETDFIERNRYIID